MSDRLNKSQRSALMGRIRAKDTVPEMTVRSLVHGLGYRYVPNARRLPGTPDLAFVSRRRVIFIHGCFWHAHDCGRGFRPATNQRFWEAKLRANVTRDRRVQTELEALRWGVMTIYECELSATEIDGLTWRIIAFLEG